MEEQEEALFGRRTALTVERPADTLRRSQIISQFLVETVVLSSVGGMIGLAIGVSMGAWQFFGAHGAKES